MSRVTEAHIEARRTAILEAAETLFARKGVAATKMAEIAEEAGLSAGAIYRYFPNKDSLAGACMDASLGQWVEQWRQLASDTQDPMAAFSLLSVYSFNELKLPAARDMTRLMTEQTLAASRADETELRRVQDMTESVVGGLASLLTSAATAGQLPAALDPQRLAEALYAFYLGVRQLQMFGFVTDGDHLLQTVQTLLDLARRSEQP